MNTSATQKTSLKGAMKLLGTGLAGLALAGAFAVSPGTQEVKASTLAIQSQQQFDQAKQAKKDLEDTLKAKDFKYINFGFDLAKEYNGIINVFEAEYRDSYLGSEDGYKSLTEAEFYDKVNQNIKEKDISKIEFKLEGSRIVSEGYDKVFDGIYFNY